MTSRTAGRRVFGTRRGLCASGAMTREGADR
jgi:hypothetical protein